MRSILLFMVMQLKKAKQTFTQRHKKNTKTKSSVKNNEIWLNVHVKTRLLW